MAVSFEEKVLRCEATLKFDRLNASTNQLDLDTSALKIESVVDVETNDSLEYTHHSARKPHLGERLSICLKAATTSVKIVYETSEGCSAAQWLPPAQTAGKVYPYLFTQCQAIHARSLVPCQDEPGVKMTYVAKITSPKWATCVMSALRESEDVDGDFKTSTWKQGVPISSYLLAMAVGELEKKDLSERCAIWSEPLLVKAAAYEFAQTEQFLKVAEDLAGLPYVWGRYDLLCLPPSFPYGGMENPVSNSCPSVSTP